MRSAPRDALISFATPPHAYASAFALHRALDAGGMLLGPIIAFALLAQIPGAFDVLWVTSFAFAVLGVAVITLFVAASEKRASSGTKPFALRATLKLLGTQRFGALAACALLLAVTTVSDGFIYLLMRERTGTSPSLIPLFYVGTSCFYMLFSIPVGLAADRWGRRNILVAGYTVLGLIYFAVLSMPMGVGLPAAIGCLALMGLYYAGSEGVLMAMASGVVPHELRTSGLAVMGTAIGIGKMISSLVFGWLWSSQGQLTAVVVFITALVLVLGVSLMWLRRVTQENAV
jgi:predicted MFS family arabinose efflux permease